MAVCPAMVLIVPLFPVWFKLGLSLMTTLRAELRLCLAVLSFRALLVAAALSAAGYSCVYSTVSDIYI